MTTVFLSGSRRISRLNSLVRSRIQDMLDQDFHIVVGDANGADKALQSYLAAQDYRNVVVFCAGQECRNNVGDWEVNEVSVNPKLKGRAFYTQKDKEMASQADYGLVLWDGKSVGSITNVYELLNNGKKAVVYLSQEKRFMSVNDLGDVDTLIKNCELPENHAIHKILDSSRNLEDSHPGVQEAFNF